MQGICRCIKNQIKNNVVYSMKSLIWQIKWLYITHNVISLTWFLSLKSIFVFHLYSSSWSKAKYSLLSNFIWCHLYVFLIKIFQKKHEVNVRKSYLPGKVWLYQSKEKQNKIFSFLIFLIVSNLLWPFSTHLLIFFMEKSTLNQVSILIYTVGKIH